MKTLLLGSAAAFGFAGGAQAADLSLSVAEPVDYVRVCDAFGSGYWYIPGTDTCLRIGGYVRVEAEFADPDFKNGFEENDGEHYTSWRFFTRANLQVEARTQTDWGPLISYFEGEADWRARTTSEPALVMTEAWLALGPFSAGMFQSAFDWGGGYTMDGLDDGLKDGTAFTDNKLIQMQLAWAFNGFGIVLAIEDPGYRDGEDTWYSTSSSSYAGDIPDLVAAVTGEWGNVEGKIAFLYTDSQPSTTWGVQGGIEVSDLGIFKLMLAASYLDVGGSHPGDIWSVLASLRADWASQWRSAVTFRYDDNSYTGSGLTAGDSWAVAFSTDYRPVDEFVIRGGIVYYDSSDSWEATLRFQRDFGG